MEFEKDVKKSIPMIILVFISSATMLSVFNIISPQLSIDYGIDSATVSLLSMVAMLMMGVASVVYSTLSDYISIRKLMLFGITLLNIGAVLSFVFSGMNFYLLLCTVALMIFGGTCGSGLLIITVTRYLPEENHAKYFGYNTACVSVSQALGILVGGVVATYIGWNYLFAIPLLSLIALPFIKKYIPDEKGIKKGKLDFIGLGLFTLFTLFISLYFNLNQMMFLIISAIILVLFIVYISKAKSPFIKIDFFKNTNFDIINVLALLVFGLQTAFSFLFPFMAQGIYGLSLDKISLILLPSYICAAFMGANSGKIVNKFGDYKALLIAVLGGACTSFIAAVVADRGIIMLGISAALFASSFAFMYAPFMKMVIGTLPMNMIGAGIGFFNLITGIGPSLFIVFTGKMMSTPQLATSLGIVSREASLFSNILLVYVVILVVVALVLLLKRKTFNKGGEK
ncbi:MAG: MFS transporter [Lachnospiraceae bacterium]|nr:MFS transporter [Lachnospiraceae bacterium]